MWEEEQELLSNVQNPKTRAEKKDHKSNNLPVFPQEERITFGRGKQPHDGRPFPGDSMIDRPASQKWFRTVFGSAKEPYLHLHILISGTQSPFFMAFGRITQHCSDSVATKPGFQLGWFGVCALEEPPTRRRQNMGQKVMLKPPRKRQNVHPGSE